MGGLDEPYRKSLDAVRGYEGQALDRETFLDLLVDRLDYLLSQEDDPKEALSDLIDHLEAAGIGLNHSQRENRKNYLRMIVWNLKQTLNEMGVPGERIPSKFPPNDPKAQENYEEMTLENWMNSLLEDRPNPDR
jgi:hypothetical protein